MRKWRMTAVLFGLLAVLCFVTAAEAAAERTVTMNVQNAEIRDVLTSIASVGGANIVLDESVKGKITVNMKNVPVDQALDIVVKAKGLAYQKMPNGTIVVAEAKTLVAGFGEAKIFPLKYAVAADVKKVLAGVVADERIKVDETSNSLLFFGSPAEADQIESALETLDQPCRQVTIEAEVLEISRSAGKELGFDWSYAPGPVQSGSTEDRDLNNYGAISFGRAPDGNPYQFRYKAQLNALISRGDAKVLAKPKISTISGKEAKIVIGDRVPVESQTTTNGTTSTSVTYVDTGIRLVYTPVISADGKVRAHLLAEVSTPSAALDNTNYKIQTRTAETDLVMNDGETIAVGGLISSAKIGNNSKVPILGDIPIVGGLFRNTVSSDNKTEIVVVLTANIVKNQTS